MGNARESMIFTAASSAFMYARTMTVGWMSFSRKGCERWRISPADDDGGGSVADLLVLRAAELDHGLGRGVSHVDLAKDGVAIVRQHDTSGSVEDHLEHGTRTERGADDIRDGLNGSDVVQLRGATGLTLRV